MNAQIRGFMCQKHFIVLLFSLAVGMVSSLGSPAALARLIKSNDSIRVIILKNFPPQFVTTTDGPSGLAVEIMREVAKRSSLDIEFVSFDSWKEVYDPLKNGSVDAISNMGISDARKKIFEFTDSYEVFDIKIFIRSETSNIKSLDDMKGKLLGVQTTNVLTKGLVESGDYQIRQYASFNLALLGLLSGEVDAVPAPTDPFLLIARGARLDDRIKYVGPSLLEVKRAIALPKGRTKLRDRLNKSLREFKQTENYQQLITKWYGSATPYWSMNRLLLLMAAVFAIFILIMAIWRYHFIVRFNHRIHESEKRYRNLFDNAEVSIWNEDFSIVYKNLENLRRQGVTDLNQYLKENPETKINMATNVRVIHVNNMTCKLFAADNENDLIDKIDKTFGSNAMDIFTNELCAIWDKKDSFRAEADLIALDGKKLSCIISFLIPKTADGFNSVPVSILDITSHKETEESLRRVQKMDAVGQMAGGIAHDFNNILGIIVGNLSFLKRELVDNEKSLKRVETASKAAMRATDLTRQLLGFSRHQAQRVQPTDINLVIQAMESLISRSITPEVEVELSFSKDLWLTEIDSADLEDALLNLILNARDAMPGGGELTIETSNKVLDTEYAKKNSMVNPGDYVELVINDTGTGIIKEIFEHIFEPFFTTKIRGKGTGLGLSMVFGFIQRSNGHIKVYSEPGIGTTVRCYLPRSTGTIKDDKRSALDISIPPRGQETVLVVDDEEELLSLAQQYLVELGYTVLTATTGSQALEVLSHQPGIDLLFSDVVMPGNLNGYELAEQTCALYPAIKVLLTSGFTSKSLYKNGQAHFKASLLNKPYNQYEIATRIRRVLDE